MEGLIISQFTGSANELKAMALYNKQGYEVFIPIDNSKVDFIALKDSIATKVQVKTAAKRRGPKDTKQYTVGILTSTKNGKRTGYSLEEVDEFCIIDESRAFIIPQISIFPKKSIMLDSTDSNYEPSHGFDIDKWTYKIS